MMRWVRLCAALAVSLATLGGLADVGHASAAPSQYPPSQLLRWGPCPPIQHSPTASCATVRVPRDYAQPAGPTIAITVSRIPARDPARKRGVLFGNPGGPGGSALSMFTDVPPPAAVRDEWDLIGVQPRGLLDATPVRCGPISSDMPPLFDIGAANRERCDRSTPGFLRTITTENTARDIESVRKMLGNNKISLYGISYGTLLMATYATLFPQHVDRMVLDSAMQPAWTWNDVLAEQTPHYKARVMDMMAWIAQHDNIYHLGRTPLAVYRAWSAKVSAESGVPPSLAGPPAQVGDVPPGLRKVAQQYIAGVNLTADARARFENLLATLVTPGGLQAKSGLYGVTRVAAPDRNLWPLVALRMAGRAPAPVKTPPAVVELLTNLQDMQTIILCNENQVPARPTEIPASLLANYIVGDLFEGPGLLYQSGMACAGAPPVTKIVGVRNTGLAVAPLQIQSIGDPQTPYSGAGAMQRLMGTHLITVGGGDHGQLGRSNAPLDAAITEYLRTGRTAVTSVPQAPIVASLTTAPRGAIIGR